MTKTNCVGTVSVSGYTRSDGTEVSDYERSCGAAHNDNESKDKKDKKSDTKNTDIKALKTSLYKMGYYQPEPKSETSEKFHEYPNNNLETAIKNFQKDNGLPATGNINRLTSEKLSGLSGLISDESISDLAESKIIGPLYRNYMALKKMNDELEKNNIKAGKTDDYYHSKAFYEAGQKGFIPGRFALALGQIKEWGPDKIKNMTRTENRLSRQAANEDARRDLKINRAAYNIGRKQPNVPFEESELHRKYETKGMNLLKKILNKK